MKCPICGNQTRRIKSDYRYVESGLDNVVLSGVNIFQCNCGEVMPEIRNIDAISQQIASAIIRKPAYLTGKEFRFIRKAMGFKAKEIAELLGVNPVSVSRWEGSNAKIGIANDRLIRMLYLQTIEEQSDQVYSGILDVLKVIKATSKETIIRIPYEAIAKHRAYTGGYARRIGRPASPELSYRAFFIGAIKKEVAVLVERSVAPAREKEAQDVLKKDRCTAIAGHFNTATLLTH